MNYKTNCLTIEPAADSFNLWHRLTCWWPLTSFWLYLVTIRYWNPHGQWRCRWVTSLGPISVDITLLLDSHFFNSQTLEDFSFFCIPLSRLNNKHGKLFHLVGDHRVIIQNYYLIILRIDLQIVMVQNEPFKI